MKKRTDTDEILAEYDLSRASRNKYASRFPTGSVVVVLEPDVAAAFRTSAEANEGPARPSGDYSEASVAARHLSDRSTIAAYASRL
jgi:hypothetical protein